CPTHGTVLDRELKIFRLPDLCCITSQAWEGKFSEFREPIAAVLHKRTDAVLCKRTVAVLRVPLQFKM
ncbi:MAG: hypothetical protein KDB03_23925, partial [Planctomycetales bacterium]|nr:hypothetical protein [Planctomycetales bacterium]